MAKIIPSVIHGLLIKFLTVFLEQQVCMSHLGILILVKESREVGFWNKKVVR